MSVLPKDQFPMLLRTVLEEFDPNMENNLNVFFNKIVIVPIDEMHIISRLPNQDMSMIEDAFLQRIQKKGGQFVTPSTTKKRKLQVPP